MLKKYFVFLLCAQSYIFSHLDERIAQNLENDITLPEIEQKVADDEATSEEHNIEITQEELLELAHVLIYMKDAANQHDVEFSTEDFAQAVIWKIFAKNNGIKSSPTEHTKQLISAIRMLKLTTQELAKGNVSTKREEIRRRLQFGTVTGITGVGTGAFFMHKINTTTPEDITKYIQSAKNKAVRTAVGALHPFAVKQSLQKLEKKQWLKKIKLDDKSLGIKNIQLTTKHEIISDMVCKTLYELGCKKLDGNTIDTTKASKTFGKNIGLNVLDNLNKQAIKKVADTPLITLLNEENDCILLTNKNIVESILNAVYRTLEDVANEQNDQKHITLKEAAQQLGVNTTLELTAEIVFNILTYKYADETLGLLPKHGTSPTNIYQDVSKSVIKWCAILLCSQASSIFKIAKESTKIDFSSLQFSGL